MHYSTFTDHLRDHFLQRVDTHRIERSLKRLTQTGIRDYTAQFKFFFVYYCRRAVDQVFLVTRYTRDLKNQTRKELRLRGLITL